MRKIKLSIGRAPALAVIFLTGALLGLLSIPAMAQEYTGEDINIHNHTGHTVLVFLFQDAQVHLDESGGVMVSSLRDGESAVAHIPNCEFSVLLVDNNDLWHAEYHDCNTTELNFTPATGHAIKGQQ